MALFEHSIFRLKINAKTGAVDEVSVMKRAPQPALNAAMVLALFKWKFKPGSIKELDLPVEYDRSEMRPELKAAVMR